MPLYLNGIASRSKRATVPLKKFHSISRIHWWAKWARFRRSFPVGTSYIFLKR